MPGGFGVGHIVRPEVLGFYAAVWAVDGEASQCDGRAGRALTTLGGIWPVVFDSTAAANKGFLAAFFANYRCW